MSTATLLILSARLLGHAAHADERRRPAPSAFFGARNRDLPRIGASQYLQVFPTSWFRPGRTGAGSHRNTLPGRTEWQVGSRVGWGLRLRADLRGWSSALRFLPWGTAEWQTGAGMALRERTCAGLLAVMLAALVSSGARAQEAQPEQARSGMAPAPVPAETKRVVRIGEATPQPCVVVDIAGHRAGHLDCAAQALEEAARIARRDAAAARDISVAQAGSPDVQVGVASRAGTRLRLRENFGVSIRPPAVPAPVFTNPAGPRK